MYARLAQHSLSNLLGQFPAVVLLGPRQAGKTTLAFAEKEVSPNALYLDLELPSAQRQLDDAESFFLAHPNQLVILDEVQRLPNLFTVLRGIIDLRRRNGEPSRQFLLLGSASGALLQQSSESLAGRIAQLELTPFQAREILPGSAMAADMNSLWVRGGFPLSWMAANDAQSLAWREAFIATYLEKDIPALGPRIPATTLRRLWTMLAHNQGELLDQSKLAAALAISGQTVGRYIDLLCDLMLVRRLTAWSGNVGKRLVRAPKVYVRDSGLVHALLGLQSLDSVLSHPVAGASWEGFVIEQLINAAPHAQTSFYRTSHGAEVDLVLEFRSGQTWVIEIKRSTAPTVSKGFYLAATDVGASRKLLVAPVDQPFPMKDGIEVMNPLMAA
ncbi:MAG: ATP-binding protein, partial [Comamonadaceae bacterium]